MGAFEFYSIVCFCLLAGFIVGYWLTYRDSGQEDAVRRQLKKENNDLQRSMQTSQINYKSLEEKFGRQRGQLNVLQQLCDDWSSSRETTERERAQLEADLNSKTSRISEVESGFRDEKKQRIALEDQLHKLSQELLTAKSGIEQQWRGKYSETELALSKRTVDLESIKSDRERVAKQLHDAHARIAELESEIVSSKNLIETATSNATGLKQEYVSLESGLKTTNDQLKRAQADYAKAVSQKEAALKAAADAGKQLAVVEKETETLSDRCVTLQQKLESTQEALTTTEKQLARVTEQREQALELEKASGIVSSGLQKRLDNQESTINMLRQSQDDALENLKHELQVRTEVEAKFDARAESIREDAEKVRSDYEAQIVAMREGAEKNRGDYEAQILALREDSQKLRTDFEAQIEALRKNEGQAESLREENQKLRADYEAQLDALRKKADGIKTEHSAAHESELKELREQLARQAAQYAEHSRDLRAQLTQQREEFTPLSTRCSTLESEAATYTESIVKLDAKREQIQQELDSARQQMQAQLKQDSETIGELQRERNDLRKELEQLHLQIVPLQEQAEVQRTFKTELDMSHARVSELERAIAQRDQETKRLHAQANELERLRDRYQEARQRQDSLQVQLDEMVSRQIGSESDRANLVARISELEARLGASQETISDLRKERALVLATLADQRSTQEPEATIISFTQSMEAEPQPESQPEAVAVTEDDYDAEYGGRVRRDANRGLVYTEAPASFDDLKRISGIAKVLEKRLNDFGIYTFKQIMEWKPEEIEEFSRLLAFRDRIVRDDWQGQARFFYNQKRKSVRSVA